MNVNLLGTRGRILLVEDDPEAALFAVTVLAKRGQFTVTHTADPAVALQLVAAGQWDLVFTDVEMPGMNGCRSSWSAPTRTCGPPRCCATRMSSWPSRSGSTSSWPPRRA